MLCFAGFGVIGAGSALGHVVHHDAADSHKAYFATGPNVGIGRTAFEVARHVREKPDDLQRTIARKGGHAVPAVCDLSEIPSVRRAGKLSIRTGGMC